MPSTSLRPYTIPYGFEAEEAGDGCQGLVGHGSKETMPLLTPLPCDQLVGSQAVLGHQAPIVFTD
jgi:hypothetical protein